jgi:hypothetical protein
MITTDQLEGTVESQVLRMPEEATILLQKLSKYKGNLERAGHRIGTEDSKQLLKSGNFDYLRLRIGEELFVEGAVSRDELYAKLSQEGEGAIDRRRFDCAYNVIESYALNNGKDLVRVSPQYAEAILAGGLA